MRIHRIKVFGKWMLYIDLKILTLNGIELPGYVIRLIEVFEGAMLMDYKEYTVSSRKPLN